MPFKNYFTRLNSFPKNLQFTLETLGITEHCVSYEVSFNPEELTEYYESDVFGFKWS